MLISTFNVNSINARLPHFLTWLTQTRPDVVLLQEIKCEFNSFPFFELEAVGYHAKIVGQKSYNGVAVLSPHKMEVICESLPDLNDDQARYLEVFVKTPSERIRVASIYVPNGNPPQNDPDDTSRLAYKLRFMDALYHRANEILRADEPAVLGGDFNTILTDHDVYDPILFKNNALCRESVRQRLTALTYLGFYDAFRLLDPASNGYTYWDYVSKAFENDFGLRIDYLFVSPKLADRLTKVFVDKTPRLASKPSDHTVLTALFEETKGF